MPAPAIAERAQAIVARHRRLPATLTCVQGRCNATRASSERNDKASPCAAIRPEASSTRTPSNAVRSVPRQPGVAVTSRSAPLRPNAVRTSVPSCRARDAAPCATQARRNTLPQGGSRRNPLPPTAARRHAARRARDPPARSRQTMRHARVIHRKASVPGGTGGPAHVASNAAAARSAKSPATPYASDPSASIARRLPAPARLRSAASAAATAAPAIAAAGDGPGAAPRGSPPAARRSAPAPGRRARRPCNPGNDRGAAAHPGPRGSSLPCRPRPTRCGPAATRFRSHPARRSGNAAGTDPHFTHWSASRAMRAAESGRTHRLNATTAVRQPPRGLRRIGRFAILLRSFAES